MAGNDMTPWTPRERALYGALEKVNDALCVTSPSAIAKGVLDAFAVINAALADPPPPDQIPAIIAEMQGGLDEFDGCEIDPSRHSEDVRCLNQAYVGLFQTIEEAIKQLTAIRAAKGGA